MALQQESGLVTEPNMSPMVPESPGLMLVCPQHPGLAVASRQHIPLVGSISPQPSSVNTVSHCLTAYPEQLIGLTGNDCEDGEAE